MVEVGLSSWGMTLPSKKKLELDMHSFLNCKIHDSYLMVQYDSVGHHYE